MSAPRLLIRTRMILQSEKMEFILIASHNLRKFRGGDNVIALSVLFLKDEEVSNTFKLEDQTVHSPPVGSHVLFNMVSQSRFLQTSQMPRGLRLLAF